MSDAREILANNLRVRPDGPASAQIIKRNLENPPGRRGGHNHTSEILKTARRFVREAQPLGRYHEVHGWLQIVKTVFCTQNICSMVDSEPVDNFH